MSGGRRLSRKLVLESATEVPDGAGGMTESWAALGTLWGQVVPRSGRITDGETGAVTDQGFDVWVRGAPVGSAARPMAGQRFVMQGRFLRIEAVTEDGASDFYLKCSCTEEVAA